MAMEMTDVNEMNTSCTNFTGIYRAKKTGCKKEKTGREWTQKIQENKSHEKKTIF
jgi:hypothetical protein